MRRSNAPSLHGQIRKPLHSVQPASTNNAEKQAPKQNANGSKEVTGSNTGSEKCEDTPIPGMKTQSSSMAARLPPKPPASGASLSVSAIKPLLKSTPLIHRVIADAKKDTQAGNIAAVGDKKCFTALYTKRSNKKHKVYSDGVITVTDDRLVVLFSLDTGKEVGRIRMNAPLNGLKTGNTLELRTYELEVQDEKPLQEFESGRIFLNETNASQEKENKKQLANLSPASLSSARVSPGLEASKFRKHDVVLPESVKAALQATANEAAPMHPDSLILHTEKGSGTRMLLDPYLGKSCRPHQKEGIRFMVECIAGGRDLPPQGSGRGCILADEMGLGKTLQAIAVIWTTLKQGLEKGRPFTLKALVVCPSTLVQNWANEVNKWLGPERLRCCILLGDNANHAKVQISEFMMQKVNELMIVSYDTFRRHCKKFGNFKSGLLVCDEGHRLKTAGSRTISALEGLCCTRRIILTGTPIQNNLEEFYTMCNFVNPGCFGSAASFRNLFINPIMRSQEASCSEVEQKMGTLRREELNRLSSSFVLRRTSHVLRKHLPPKTEIYVFIKMETRQRDCYNQRVREVSVQLSGVKTMGDALQSITELRKLSIHPDFGRDMGLDEEDLKDDEDVENLDDDEEDDEDVTPRPKKKARKDAIVKVESNTKQPAVVKLDWTASGKLVFLKHFLDCLMDDPKNKIVIVSNWVRTLNIIQDYFVTESIPFIRLDGSTPVSTRGNMVATFNLPSGPRIFLLSSKSGGAGLNLIGANRILLFDPDWNPATDIQAMARVWRDGQTKPVFIYRLFATGSIEEKILQRQLFKNQLSILVGNTTASTLKSTSKRSSRASTLSFKQEELLDIFCPVREDALCETVEMFQRLEEEEHAHEAKDVQPAIDADMAAEPFEQADEEQDRNIIQAALKKKFETSADPLLNQVLTRIADNHEKDVANVQGAESLDVLDIADEQDKRSVCVGPYFFELDFRKLG